MKKLLLIAALLGGGGAIAQTYTSIVPDSAKPTVAGYEQRYSQRMDTLLLSTNPGNGNPNSGPDQTKGAWARALYRLYLAKKAGDQTAINTILTAQNGQINSIFRSTWGNNFCGTFAVPGYTHYIMNNLAIAPQHHLDSANNNFTRTRSFPFRCQPGTGWDLITRPDGFMDAVVFDPGASGSNPNGSEFNSENYHWMQRMAGLLWADYRNETTRQAGYDTWIRNWVRSLYGVGRVEWNSNNYWGHTFNPLLMLHHNVTDPEHKKMAKAGADWMVTELALHYLDGFSVFGADSRAKINSYTPYAGSTPWFNYLYFADGAANRPTYTHDWSTRNFDEIFGYVHDSRYRPNQRIVDIAQRQFTMPVEIRSAKPFYRADYNDYAGWQGNVPNSRRYEFETIWMDDNYILNSLAGGRADGRIGFYSEQRLWGLGVKGTDGGAVQLGGSSGTIRHSGNGRWPYEQIAQHRNIMMRLCTNTDSMHVTIPTSATINYVGNDVYLDLGSGVYAAIRSHNATGSGNISLVATQAQYAGHRRHSWGFNNTDLAGLVLEVGTQSQYNTFAAFQAAVATNSSIVVDSVNRLIYTGANGQTLKMQHTGTEVFTLGTPMVDGTTTVPEAGKVPKAWGNTVPIDYDNFHTYEVSYGENIIRQEWGSGEMVLRTNGEGLRIRTSPTNGAVTYETFNAAPEFVTGARMALTRNARQLKVYPNPADAELFVDFGTETRVQSLELVDLSGRSVHTFALPSQLSQQQRFALPALPRGTYVLQARHQLGMSHARLVINQ